MTAKERTQRGKSRRDVVSRVSQANLHAKKRQFDPIDVLRASAEGRVPLQMPVKYARMRQSPFAFFRGAVSIMAADLGRLPNSGLHVQLCGDAHVQNLGSFATPDGKLVFDLNDFDETIRGPWNGTSSAWRRVSFWPVRSVAIRARNAEARRRFSSRVTAGPSASSRSCRSSRWRGIRSTGRSVFSRFTRLFGNRNARARWIC